MGPAKQLFAPFFQTRTHVCDDFFGRPVGMLQALANIIYEGSNHPGRVLDCDPSAQLDVDAEAVANRRQYVQRDAVPASQKLCHLLARDAALDGNIPRPAPAGAKGISELEFQVAAHALQHTLRHRPSSARHSQMTPENAAPDEVELARVAQAEAAIEGLESLAEGVVLEGAELEEALRKPLQPSAARRS